jgi:hypothetical protein
MDLYDLRNTLAVSYLQRTQYIFDSGPRLSSAAKANPSLWGLAWKFRLNVHTDSGSLSVGGAQR